jgi:hypothetical protein
LLLVLGAKNVDRICRHCHRRRDLGQEPAIGPPELERSIGLSIDPVTLFVHRTMVPAAQQREVRKRRGAAVRPAPHVMPLAERQPTAREAAAAVAVVECSTQRRRNRPRPRPDFHDPAVCVVTHHHTAGIARQAPRRFGGNAPAPLEDGLTGLIRVRQDWRVDVHHHLVPLARSAGIQLVVQRRTEAGGAEWQRRVAKRLAPLPWWMISR